MLFKRFAMPSKPTVILIFCRRSDNLPKWYLDRDFQHCFAAVVRRSGLIVLEYVDGIASLRRLRGVSVADFCAANSALDRHVLLGPQHPRHDRMKRAPQNCVETAKRFVGARPRYVLTPKQMYLYCKFILGYQAWQDGMPCELTTRVQK